MHNYITTQVAIVLHFNEEIVHAWCCIICQAFRQKLIWSNNGTAPVDTATALLATLSTTWPSVARSPVSTSLIKSLSALNNLFPRTSSSYTPRGNPNQFDTSSTLSFRTVALVGVGVWCWCCRRWIVLIGWFILATAIIILCIKKLVSARI